MMKKQTTTMDAKIEVIFSGPTAEIMQDDECEDDKLIQFRINYGPISMLMEFSATETLEKTVGKLLSGRGYLFTIEDTNGGASINVSGTGDVHFSVDRISNSMKVSVPYEACRPAFQAFHDWRKAIVIAADLCAVDLITATFEDDVLELQWRIDGRVDPITKQYPIHQLGTKADWQGLLDGKIGDFTIQILSPGGNSVLLPSTAWDLVVRCWQAETGPKVALITRCYYENNQANGGFGYSFALKAFEPAVRQILNQL